MDLIAIADPRFQPQLIEEAKRSGYIYRTRPSSPQARPIPRGTGDLENHQDGEPVLFRPVRISDEPLLQEFLYSLSEASTYRSSCREGWTCPTSVSRSWS